VSTSQLIEKEVSAMPEELQREVYDFARFLRHKKEDDSFNGLLLSESALAKDWNNDAVFNELTAMAGDPQIQRELHAINTEFAAAESDGLGKI
jgi:Protein of unknown function (DUF2281)